MPEPSTASPVADVALAPADPRERGQVFAPRVRLVAVAVVCAALAWLMIWLALATPVLGLQLRVDGEQVQVVAGDARTGGAAIPAGTRLLALEANGERIAVGATALIEEPDFLPSYAAYNAFLAEQGRLAALLALETVTLDTDSGRFVLMPRPRALGDLPPSFWFQLACGLIAALTGISVRVFRPDSTAAGYYALTGASFLFITFTAAVYSSRELALGTDLFRTLSAIDHLGAMVFSGGFLGLLWHYPNDIGSPAVARLVLGAYLGVWLLDTLQWLPGTDWGIRLPVMAGLLVSAAFAAVQWRRASGRPVDRAALKWFLFSLYFAGTTFVVGVFVAVWLGFMPVVPQGYAFGVVVFMYLGIALGIIRYRLFDLERWWVAVWLWLLAGAALIGVDMLLVYWLQMNEALALSVGLALVGWLYFPVRQWLYARLLKGAAVSLEALFPRLLELGLATDRPDDLRRIWFDLLRQVFEPLHLERQGAPALPWRIGAEGLELTLPALGPIPPVRVAYPAAGKRLFTNDDVVLAHSLWELARRAIESRERYEQGAQEERRRIARDLHDDLGGRLLTLIHRAGDAATVNLARDAMRELRSVLQDVEARPCLLGDAVRDWRAEAEERCDAAGVRLVWHVGPAAEPISLTAAQRLNLLRILREALSNALRHAAAERIVASFSVAHGRLRLQVLDNGSGTPPEQWPPGRGLANMRRRARDLGGDLCLAPHAHGGACVQLSIPLGTDGRLGAVPGERCGVG